VNNTNTNPQQQYYSSQDIVAPNIVDLFNKVIKNIDSHRSTFVINKNISELIKNKKIDDLFISGGTLSSSYQESRTNAFYRMLGFPVINEDGTKSYSPGHDPSLNQDDTRISNNLEIAASYLNKFENISTKRELYSVLSNNVLAVGDENSTVAALGIMYLRPFDKQLNSSLSPIDIDEQTFNITSREFLKFKFPSANVNVQSIHILKPFVVDPRIELTVLPATNRICAPFIKDKSKTQLSKGTYLKRPYIERVIEIRFNKSNVFSDTSINGYIKDILSYVKNNSNILDANLVNSTANPQALHQSELLTFSKFFNVITALLDTLAFNIQEINRNETKINWKPIPNKNGLERGLSLNKVDYNDVYNQAIEIDIANQKAKKYLAQTTFDVGYYSKDVSNFSFSNIDDVIFGGDKIDSSFYEKQIQKLNNRRNELGNSSNQMLTEIEMITGEFSGIGLLDVMAIQAALWIISPQALLGLIDNAAINRMQNNKALITELALPNARLSPLQSLQEFETKLSQIYSLISSYYSNIQSGKK